MKPPPVALLGLLAMGCAYTVQLTSVPSGAQITLPDGTRVTTPFEVVVPWGPRRPYPLRVEALGYEPLAVDLQRTEGQLLRYIEGSFATEGTREVCFVLVPPVAPLGSDQR
jgi:hypothetical protein